MEVISFSAIYFTVILFSLGNSSFFKDSFLITVNRELGIFLGK